MMMMNEYLIHSTDEDEYYIIDLRGVTSTLKPVMITDATALYDSFHREATSSSVMDKRVMKERLLELGGTLKWMFSDRQIANGLTKDSARTLMASLNLTWGPEFKARKKKTKSERTQILAEITSNQ